MIKLRKLETSDKSVIAKLLNNKKIWNNLTNKIPYPYTERDAEIFLKFIERDKHHKAFAIELNREFCGIIGLIKQQDVREKSAELGYWIGEPFWNKGITTEAVKLITEYGFSNLNIIRIYSTVFEYNIASMKVLEKNGYKKEGIFKKAIFKNNKIWDEHRYFKLKDNL
jgi:RimJ/RimL family protein N-acetyltransferase